jgi:hypothetical protein
LNRCITLDNVALTIHALLILTLVLFKGGGVIIVSWLWVFAPLLYSAAHFALYIIYGLIRIALMSIFLRGG